MDVGETTPQQTFAQINVLIAPAPIAIREPVSRRELLLLDEDDAAEKNVDQPFRQRQSVTINHQRPFRPSIIRVDPIDVMQADIVNFGREQVKADVYQRPTSCGLPAAMRRG
jgi:hypothetical protein